MQNDERAYLSIKILGVEFLGLLDSGASRTILGGPGWECIRHIGVSLVSSKKSFAVLADGRPCAVVGSVFLPVQLIDRLKIMEILVIPELPHKLILGKDFWVTMEIVPCLKHNVWHFCEGAHQRVHVDGLSFEASSVSLLSPNQQERLDELIAATRISFGSSLGCTDKAEHVIKTTASPIKQRYYRVSPVLQSYIDKELEDMLSQGIVEPSKSPWASPVVMVRKKDGTYRFCVDYRKLNLVTERDSYPLPMVADTLDKLRDARYLSSLDLKSAFFQVPVAESSRPYTAFTVPNRGLFQFRRMPFGLTNSPATWQRLIDSVLGADLEPNVFVYLDDIVVVTQTFDRHLEVLEEVFRRLKEANLTVSWDKCQFCRDEMRYLGYVIDRRGLRVDPDKVKAMLDLPAPTDVRGVRRILGTFSWYRRFIADFSNIVAPISGLLRKNKKFVWTDECNRAFLQIKEALVMSPILCCPDYSLPFVVGTDASGFGIGAVLSQPHPDGDRVVCFLSRSLTRQERNYSTTERECLAVLWAIEKLRPYIEGVEFTVVTDHYSLKWLHNLKEPTGRLARWSLRLQQYTFKIEHRKGKDNVVPDMLSRSVPVLDSVDVCELNAEVTCTDVWYSRMLQNVQSSPLKFSNWRISDGKLYKFVKVDYPSACPASSSWKLVVPKSQRLAVIRAAHDAPVSGHMGVYKTFSRLADRYFWPKMRADVTAYIRRCNVCAAHKPDQKGKSDPMVSHAKPSLPWEVVSVDLVGPLPRSTKGNSFILVVTDYLSKFSLAFPIRKSTTEVVIRRLEEEVFLMFGVPRILLCDNGPQFRGSAFRKFLDRYQTNIKFNANYHPRANPTERTNRTIKTMLSMYVDDNHRKWDSNLHQVCCALRTAKHETTKVSPFFVNFGRNMIVSGTEYQDKGRIEDEGDVDWAERSRNNVFREIYKDVKRRLEISGKRSAERYNLRKRSEQYVPGQAVWKKNYVLSDAKRHFSGKLAPRYLGPFYVKKRISPWVYELVDGHGKSKGNWHTKDLKSGPSGTD